MPEKAQLSDQIAKLPFTAKAAPDPDDSNAGSTGPHDLDHYEHKGPPATNVEVASYYAYYAGNNGIGSFQYSNLLFQNLIYQAGFDPAVKPLGSAPCDTDTACHVFWNGGHKDYSSVVLIASGLSFLCQSIVFLTIGTLADYGGWNPWLVRIISVICWGFEFGFLGLKTADVWRAAMALYILSSVTWWASYVFFNAVFPKLAHDLPEIHRAREEFLAGNLAVEDYEYRCSMARSKIMNISWVFNNVGFVVACAFSLAALKGVHADDSTANNNWGYSVSVAVVTGFWIILAIPWFIWEKKRPGPNIPKGDNYLTFGVKQTWFTCKQAWKLKQTFLYLICFFLLADGIGTTTTMVAITQNQVVVFSATKNTYLIMVQGCSAIVGVYSAYAIQRYFKLRTKTMLQISNFGCVLLPLWGMVGIWTTRFGFHNLWEFWAFAGQYGFTLGAQFGYGQAFMAELVPKGREYMFFSLLGIVSKGAAWIGPIVVSAISDSSGNYWCGFPFVAALTFVPFVGIFFVDEVKSRQECAEYLSNEAVVLRKETDGHFEAEALEVKSI